MVKTGVSANSDSVEYLLQSSAVSRLIGSKGANIASVREKSGCIVKLEEKTVRGGMRQVFVSGPVDLLEGAEAILREALGSQADCLHRAEGYVAPMRTTSLTFTAFTRGSEQPDGAPEREAPGETAGYRGKGGRQMMKVGNEEVRLNFSRGEGGGRRNRSDSDSMDRGGGYVNPHAALAAGLGSRLNKVARCERCGVLGHNEDECPAIHGRRDVRWSSHRRGDDDGRRRRSRSRERRRRRSRSSSRSCSSSGSYSRSRSSRSR